MKLRSAPILLAGLMLANLLFRAELAGAGIVTYDNRAAWEAALAASPTCEDFESESLPPSGTAPTPYTTNAGVLFDTLTTPVTLQYLDPGLLGSGELHWRDFTAGVRVSFPTTSSAFGFDYDTGGAPGDDKNLTANGVTTLIPRNETGFIGYVEDTGAPIHFLDLVGSAGAQGGISMDDLCWSTSEVVMFMEGVVTGTVNGTKVDFDVNIEMNFDTGEETASTGNLPPDMGAILEQVTAIFTIAGPTGGRRNPPLDANLFDLSGGNFTNLATVFWPDTEDTLEIIHDVTFDGGDTLFFSATMNGTVPVIELDDQVIYSDFRELLVPAENVPRVLAQQLIISGVGFQGDFTNAECRQYLAGSNPVPTKICKGSHTLYEGDPAPDVIVRAARDISSVYDPDTQTLHVHLFNELSQASIFSDGFESGNTSAWGQTIP